MRVTVIGTGYVGTVTGACLAYLGHRVTCVDTDLSKIEKLRRGQSPIYEPGLDELIVLAQRAGRNRLRNGSRGCRSARVTLFSSLSVLPRCPRANPISATSKARPAASARAMDSSRFRVVVNKSTVPVGSGNLVEALVRDGILESHPALSDAIAFGVASNPEFLREGSAILDSLYPDRIVVGADDPVTLETMRQLYAPLIEQRFPEPSFAPRPVQLQSGPQEIPIVATTITSAEMIKYSANAFLALKIGFSNEMANICERVGADVTEVMTGIGLDWRIGRGFLNAGIGWGGSCFGKDISSLLHTAAEYGYQARILESSLAVNRMQRSVVIQKLQEKLFILKGRTVALLGLAFKPNTDDLRDAPSLQIAEKLIQMGARVRAYDPVAMTACREQYPDLRITYCDDAMSAADHADALVLVTEWPEFAGLNLKQLAKRMNKAVLIDGRNLFQPRDRARGGLRIRRDRPRHAPASEPRAGTREACCRRNHGMRRRRA